MKFRCGKKELAEALAGVSKAVAPTSTVPVLQGILFRAEGFKLELTGYDLEMAITTSIDAHINEPGELLLAAKLIGDMVRSMPGEEIEIESDANLATHISCGITSYDLMGMSSEDFPELPRPDAEKAFEMDAAELSSMIGTTIYAVSVDDKKPAHTGQLFEIEENELTIVALDGFRLAVTKHPISSGQQLRIVVPAKTAAEVSRLMGESGESISVNASKRYVVFSGGGYTVMSRLIEGEFHNFRTAIPEGHKTRAVVDVDVLEKAIQRCSVIITERLKNPLRMVFSEEGIDIRCQTPLGKVHDRVEAQLEGETVEIGFNYRYLLDALRNAGCDKVVLELSGQLSPVKVLPAEGDEFLFLVLPVRFKND